MIKFRPKTVKAAKPDAPKDDKAPVVEKQSAPAPQAAPLGKKTT